MLFSKVAISLSLNVLIYESFQSIGINLWFQKIVFLCHEVRQDDHWLSNYANSTYNDKAFATSYFRVRNFFTQVSSAWYWLILTIITFINTPVADFKGHKKYRMLLNGL